MESPIDIMNHFYEKKKKNVPVNEIPENKIIDWVRLKGSGEVGGRKQD